jgi:isopenicillin N synthase-like dioxygenase
MSLPVIDMSALFGGDRAARAAVAAPIASACEGDRFFCSVPIAKALARTVCVYAQNGELRDRGDRFAMEPL